MNTVQNLEIPIHKSLEYRQKAEKVVKQRTLYAAGLGFIPIPILDSVSVTSLQVWMIKDIAQVYDIPFKKHFVKSLIGAIIGNLGSLSIIKFIPVIGISFGGSAFSVSAASATYALGRVFIQHFDQGGTLLDFNPTASRSFFLKIYSNNQRIMEDIKQTNIITQLKNVNAQLIEEEKVHEELHQEAEQFIIELKEALKAQEKSHSKKQKQAAKTIKELEYAVQLIKQQNRIYR